MLGWSVEEVEERLTDAAELWRRTPASGFGPGRSSPFASDAPWHLLTRSVRADINSEGLKRAEIDELLSRAAEGTPPPRAGGLDRDEVARRDEASEWFGLVPERDRTLVVAVVWWQATTGRRPDWARMLDVVGLERGKEGVRKRYRRAIEGLADALNRRAVRKAA